MPSITPSPLVSSTLKECRASARNSSRVIGAVVVGVGLGEPAAEAVLAAERLAGGADEQAHRRAALARPGPAPSGSSVRRRSGAGAQDQQQRRHQKSSQHDGGPLSVRPRRSLTGGLRPKCAGRVSDAKPFPARPLLRRRDRL